MLRNAVFELLRLFGESLTLRKIGSQVYSTTTGLPAGTETNIAARGKIINYTEMEKAKGLAKEGEFKAILSPIDTTQVPALKDFIVDGSTVYAIQSVHKIKDKSTDIAYICKVKA